MDLELSEITMNGFSWRFLCFKNNVISTITFSWMATWHPDIQVIQFEENFSGSSLTTGNGNRAQTRTKNIIFPKVSVPNSIVVTTGFNLTQVGGHYNFWVHVDSTTLTTVDLKITAFEQALVYSVRGYILIWDNRLFADFGTIGGKFDACNNS